MRSERARANSRAYVARQLAKDPKEFRRRDHANYRAYVTRQLTKDPEGFRKRNRARVNTWRARHLETVRERQKRIPRERRMLHCAKSRAKRLGVPFDLALSDIVIPAVCPVLGIPITRGSGKHIPQSPTLDRTVPALGYVKGNITVISYRANMLKNNATAEELQKVVDWIIERN